MSKQYIKNAQNHYYLGYEKNYTEISSNLEDDARRDIIQNANKNKC